MTVLDRIGAQRVVPVLRASDANDAVATARACANAGMNVVELTLTTRDAFAALHELRYDGLELGLGTVTHATQVARAASAGACFVVSFTAPRGLIRAAERAGVTAIPGALTPTEVCAALSEGAPAVKLFPARAVSPGYLRDLRTVLPGLRAIVTGGVEPRADTVRRWLRAGALAVGIGNSLGTVAKDGADEIERRARAIIDFAADCAS